MEGVIRKNIVISNGRHDCQMCTGISRVHSVRAGEDSLDAVGDVAQDARQRQCRLGHFTCFVAHLKWGTVLFMEATGQTY